MKAWNYRAHVIMIMILACASCVSPALKTAEPDVRSLTHWSNWKLVQLEDRIAPASDAMVEFILQDNIKNEIPNRPSRPPYNEAVWADVRQAVLTLPDTVKKLANGKLAAIVLIENLGSTGFSDSIKDEQGKPLAGFIVLDVKAIDRKANDWATWKEDSPFANAPHVKLQAFIEEPNHNNRIATVQYILLHEIGHILAIGGKFHPAWDEQPKSTDALIPYPFSSVSWKINAGNFEYEPVSKRGCDPVHYYIDNPNLSRSKAESCYRALELTAFVSLYASTNPFDDFAETFAFYVHRVLLKKPWYLEISSSNKAYRYEPSWTEARFDPKRKIIESLLTE